MSTSKQPLLFASGTFFTALLITVSFGIFSHYTYKVPEKSVFQVQAAPYETCWQSILPADTSVEIADLSFDGTPIDLNYPLSSIDHLIKETTHLRYTITTQPYKQIYQLVTIRNSPRGERAIAGSHGVSQFRPLACDSS